MDIFHLGSEHEWIGQVDACAKCVEPNLERCAPSTVAGDSVAVGRRQTL